MRMKINTALVLGTNKAVTNIILAGMLYINILHILIFQRMLSAMAEYKLRCDICRL